MVKLFHTIRNKESDRNIILQQEFKFNQYIEKRADVLYTHQSLPINPTHQIESNPQPSNRQLNRNRRKLMTKHMFTSNVQCIQNITNFVLPHYFLCDFYGYYSILRHQETITIPSNCPTKYPTKINPNLL